MDNNRNLKLIAAALDIGKKDIARAATIGGQPTSNSQADGWLRGAQSAKSPTGNTRGDKPLSRSRPMPDEAFLAFCLGLKEMLDELDADA